MSIASEIQRIKTNIANAYTSASNKGATLPATQNSANLSSTIDTIQTGGTPTTVEWKDVNFIDYDGTLLHSYTIAEIQQLSALPSLPSHPGLVCQGWNWTLANIKSLNREVIVGAVYNTTDGSTKILIEISSLTDATINLCLKSYSGSSTLTINWGDETIESFTQGTSVGSYSHTYSAIGKFTITLSVPSGHYLLCGGTTVNYALFGNGSNNRAINYRSANKVCGINIGSNFKYITAYMLNETRNCKYVTIAEGVSITGSQAFQQSSFECIVLPKSVTKTQTYCFSTCRCLKTISLPNELTDIGNYAFQMCYVLKNITFGNSISSIGSSVFTGANLYSGINNEVNTSQCNASMYSSTGVVEVTTTATTIGASCFNSCTHLYKVICLGDVTSVGNSAFGSTYSLTLVDFTHCTTVPTARYKHI